VNADFSSGAVNAVRVCLGISERDRVAVIKDRSREPIAAAIEAEIGSTGAELRTWTMEDLAPRPLRDFPAGLGEAIVAFHPTASFYIGGSQPGELAFRRPLLDLLTHELRCRHGHMVGIDERLMTDGMATDYEEVYRVTRQVYEAVRSASRIEVTTRLGTELVATLTQRHRWIPCDGRYHEQGLWGNLPEGEVFTAPMSLEGLLVGEEMGDHFAAKYGLFEEPVRIRIKGGRVAAVEAGSHPELKAEIETYFGQHSDSNRAGEFAIGTNVGLTQIVGNFLQDEKFPGVHVAFGDPYGHETGADWSCPSHVDVLGSHANVVVDGRPIMEAGRFLV
jgi:leucyl aminopeptidase (aminopeptidase T)